MSVKDLQGNEVSNSAVAKPAIKFLAVALAAVIIAAIFGYRIYDCTNFNHLNRQRLRNLENFGAAATLRDGLRGWSYPWLVKDTSPVNLIFFDHPRFEKKALTETDITQIERLIKALPNVSSIHIARKSMSPEIVDDLRKRLDTIEFTTE
jgi:hypothetical protein